MSKKRTCVIDGRLRVESRILRYWYDTFNRDYFFGRLPKDAFLFWDGEMFEKGYGRYYEAAECSLWQMFPAISIATHLRYGNVFVSTLLHEMIHASGKMGHKDSFDRERKRLLRYKRIREILL